MRSMIVPLRLRSGERGRKVTWLELFFDLIFVAAVSQVASPLRDDYTFAGLLRLTPLFALIWWAWTGNSLFATRFDTDDVVQRALTLLQMFAVAVMAANARDALDSRSSAGFAAAYAAVRLILVAQYVRARSVREAHVLATRYAAGHGAAACLWLISAVVPAPGRLAIWLIAFAFDLGTPWLAIPHSAKAPPDASHLPERFGLFTLILLGESVVALMRGIESQDNWPAEAAGSAFLGMSLLFVLWWWYFDGAGAAEEQLVRSHRDAVRLHLWSYAHFPLLLGIVILGAGIERSVTAAAHASLSRTELVIMTGSAALIMSAMAGIGATSTRWRSAQASPLMPTVASAVLTLAAGGVAQTAPPICPVAGLFIVCAGLLATWLTRESKPLLVRATV